MTKKKTGEYYYVLVEDTKTYGIIQAAIIGKVKTWCEYNEKHKIEDRFYDGYWWTGYMTPKVFSEQLGIPEATIKKNLIKLVSAGVLIQGRFNKQKRDRTNWYRYNPSDLRGTMESTLEDQSIVPERTNPSDLRDTMDCTPEVPPLPVISSVISSVSQKTVISSVKSSINPFLNTDEFKKNNTLKYINEYFQDDLRYLLQMLVEGNSLTTKQKDMLVENKHQLIKKLPILKEYIKF